MQARKIKPEGRSSYVIEFRHPRVKDKQGRYGKKIRRGLGTTDESEAQTMVDQMNILLSDESYWQPSAKASALGKFDVGIVNAFYDEIDHIINNDEKIRERIIPLKTQNDGYSRVLLLGSTGAGKTTLLRQLMGTDPINERFPATSTARTTVFDTEIILSEGSYKGVVTFFSESETRQMVIDAIQNAMIEFFNRNDESHTLRVFLESKDQRFRLSYLIGKIRENKEELDEHDFSNEDSDDSESEQNQLESTISNTEQKEFEEKIYDFLNRIISMTKKITEKDKQKYRSDELPTEELKNLLEEIILNDILDYDGDDLATLADEILDEIKQRFKEIKNGDLNTEKFGWPIYWFYENNDRDEFVKTIRSFASNSANRFGKLLTPLVSGMRVEGPFKPEFLTNIPKLVIYDGEGLGHIPDTTSNLPSKIIKKFDQSDAILLVDSSQSPMLASPYAVIKSTAISGHSQKLLLCFTHFDAVKGDNLQTIEDKKSHIWGSVDGLLAKLDTELDYEIKKYLLHHLDKNTFYLGYLDERLAPDKKFRFSINQLKELIKRLDTILPEKSTLAPSYDVSTLIFKIRKAAMDFNNRWEGHLFGNDKWRKQHFTRIKALSRRLGNGWEDEYQELRPISDFWSNFNSQISGFLSSPSAWNQSNPNEEDIQKSIDSIKQKVSARIFDYATKSIKNDKIGDWQTAYDFSGQGSSLERARKIESIYNDTVPIPEDEMMPPVRQFLSAIMRIIRETVVENGGKVTSIYNT